MNSVHGPENVENESCQQISMCSLLYALKYLHTNIFS